MTQEQKRIKLAEAGGLKVIDVPFIPSQTKAAGCVFTDAARTEWRKCYPNSCGVYGIPDYFSDLNAVHELEKVILHDLDTRRLWQCYLAEATHAKGWFEHSPCCFERVTRLGLVDLMRATAAQRAEALGLLLKLW